MNPSVLYARQRYGGAADELAPESVARQARALMIIIGADGRISDPEKQAFLELARLLGATDAMIAELRGFDYLHERLEDYLEPADPPVARRLLYDAITIAHADGYADAERDAARRAAEILRVDASALTAIEALVEMEVSLRHARAALLNPRR
jgi:tellurite resistance protein